MFFFCRQFQGGADFVDHFKFIFHAFMLSLPGDIYVKNLTYTLYCGGWCVRGRGRNQGVARLELNGCGIAVPEIFGAIREDSR